MLESFFLHVIMADDDVYEVFDCRTVAVWPTLRSCTCRKWNVICISCRHACAIIRFMQHSVMNYLDHMKVEIFKRTYAPKLYPIPDFDKPNVSFSNIQSTLVCLCPFFWHYVHISGYLSTFMNICPNLGVYIHISDYMSILWSICTNYYPIFILWYSLMSRTSIQRILYK